MITLYGLETYGWRYIGRFHDGDMNSLRNVAIELKPDNTDFNSCETVEDVMLELGDSYKVEWD